MTQYNNQNKNRRPNLRRPPTPVQRFKPPADPPKSVQEPASKPTRQYEAKRNPQNQSTLTGYKQVRTQRPPVTPPRTQQQQINRPPSNIQQSIEPDFDDDDLEYVFDEDAGYIPEDDTPSIPIVPKKRPGVQQSSQSRLNRTQPKAQPKRPQQVYRPPAVQYTEPELEEDEYEEEYFEEEEYESWEEFEDEEREPWSFAFRPEINLPDKPSMGLVLGTVFTIVASLSLLGVWLLSGWWGDMAALSTAATSNTAGFARSNNPPAIVAANGAIAPFFSPSVQYWEPQILAWSERHQLDPNMIATIMQIESCGDPQALSSAGAQGLFQVMPFHFQDGENAFDPDINALRGMNYLSERLIQTQGDVGRAFAGYNGGHVAAAGGWNDWVSETQRYFTWSTGIYSEALEGNATSDTLTAWIAAGGANLCNQAEERLGLR